MVKLVEEVVISSDVLVDALVQVGFLDEVFGDGKVSDIYSNCSRDEINTYRIKVEKEIKLNNLLEQLSKAKEVVNGNNEGRGESHVVSSTEEYKEYLERVKNTPQFTSPLEFAVQCLLHEGERVLSKEELSKYVDKLKDFKF